MKKTINGENMFTKYRAYQEIKSSMNLKSFYGNNLDALWDVLTTISEPTEVEILNKEALIGALESYGESILEVFKEASEENKNLIWINN